MRGVRFSSSMNHHNSSLRMAHEYRASREAFERLTQIMCTEVSIPVSDRYNALYGEEDLHHSLILLSIEGRYAESGMRRLAVEASSTRVPSGSWVRDAVSRLSEGEVTEKVERALGSTLRELRRFGVFNEPVVCAMDKHQIPRYDEGMEPFLTRGQKKAGTMKFETYATLQCVEEGRRAQVACAHVGPLDDNADVIAGLLEQARLREDRGLAPPPGQGVLLGIRDIEAEQAGTEIPDAVQADPQDQGGDQGARSRGRGGESPRTLSSPRRGGRSVHSTSSSSRGRGARMNRTR